MRCPSCSAAVADERSDCPECGVDLGLSSMTPTGTAPRGEARPATPVSSGRTSSTPAAAPSARFVPGTILAERYRIVGLIGKGGMGEVYRADDLKLGQTIALKFLPQSLENDVDRLERFVGEVRTARQITHPNVCRVHDIDEVDGHHFLSMEYVDGEDLASLLRRIGRLPEGKALEIARQLCAGVASAHDRGVLHRDLKPENVMVDGRGQVRITDFGLAGLADGIAGADVRSGTPAYMAPEQLSGAAVTARSDIYALGLVLYEVLTGKRAFEGRTLAERRKSHGSTPAPPSSLVADIDPALERVILRCLEEDPLQRPPSARAMAAALPGGDPLAAALAAGETPSPEMVAAAGEPGSLRPAVAWAWLVGLMAVTALSFLVFPQQTLLGRVAFDKPPAALEDRAKEILDRAGYDRKAADEARSLDVDDDYLSYAEAQSVPESRRRLLAAGPTLQFWYRQSPRPIVSLRFGGTVGWSEPAPLLSGMTGVRLDGRGRLLEMYAVPPQVEEDGAAAIETDWNTLLAAAGLDPTRLQTAEPRWTPGSYCDRRLAWEADHPEVPGIRLRIEGAAYRGRPVWFQVIGPWTRADRMRPFEMKPGLRTAYVIGIVLGISVLIGSALLARHNARLGRADRRGAFRLARYTFATTLAGWALAAHHVPVLEDELLLLVRAFGLCLLLGSTLWVFYVALEPYVRRHWPERIVGWSRLLAGRLRDPLLGRDALLGATCGAAAALLSGVLRLALERAGMPITLAWSASPDALLGVRELANALLEMQFSALLDGMFLMMLLLLLRTVLRRDWMAAVVFASINATQNALIFGTREGGASVFFAVSFAMALLFVLILVRLGLLAMVVALFFEQLLRVLPLTSDFSSWYAGTSLVYVLIALGSGGWGFWTALAGQPAFGGEWLKD
jgi:serine/threonine-protein kinase